MLQTFLTIMLKWKKNYVLRKTHFKGEIVKIE